MRAFNWRPLHVAIAWVITRDEQFCVDIAQNASAKQRTFCASAQLEHEMIEAGCFNVVNEIMTCDPPARTVEIETHRVIPGYTGRFRGVAEDYEVRGRTDFTNTIAQLPHAPECERNRIPLGDYLLGRWHEAFRDIASCISDGGVKARGVAVDGATRQPAGEWPAASVNDAMWLDVDGVVWEGPKILSGEQPRRWVDTQVHWGDLKTCFEPFPGPSAESLCQAWLEAEMRKSPQRRSHPREGYLREALRRFGGLASLQFGRAWKNAIQTTGATAWSRGGRPRKNPQEKSHDKK